MNIRIPTSDIRRILGTTLIVLGLLLTSGSPAFAESEEKPSAFLPIDAAAKEELPARMIKHFESLWLIGKPLTETCDDFGVEMNEVLDLIEPDFDAAANLEMNEEQQLAFDEAYDKLSALAGRCLKDEGGRRFNVRLINKMKVIRGQQ